MAKAKKAVKTAKKKAVKKQTPSQHELTVHDRRAYNRKIDTLKRQMRSVVARVSALEDRNDGVGL